TAVVDDVSSGDIALFFSVYVRALDAEGAADQRHRGRRAAGVTPADGGAGEVGGGGPRVGVGEGGHRHQARAGSLGGRHASAVGGAQGRVGHGGCVGGAGRRATVIDDGRGGGVRALVGVRVRTRDAEGAAAQRHRRR